eukprot:CAMPEP_0194488426 /NCGR_PEP_ID=MMETSP0253-20130528/8353_1 /TAXON_ID=2966 /ORGANISM="Noctiluca scintillans" /LENGTH=86 /DNA_ID=CAMNT_0039328789 /DNA_START=410 /DNA_END=670 /DNA_ORIENTATION=-
MSAQSLELSDSSCQAARCDNAHPHAPSVRCGEQSSAVGPMVAMACDSAALPIRAASAFKCLSRTSFAQESCFPSTAVSRLMPTSHG